MMSATRLLILGVLRFKQPIHGYDVRRELESWQAERWANIAYGSIYFALNKMAEEGLVEVVDTHQAAKGPARTTYTLTVLGEAEFQRLLREYWWEPKTVIDPFQVALAFITELPRDELLAALRHRAAEARAKAGDLESAIRSKIGSDTPRHVTENMRLAAYHVETDARWTEEAIGKVERGELP
jgi:DNA-binding PadR family transcriptional regulator